MCDVRYDKYPIWDVLREHRGSVAVELANHWLVDVSSLSRPLQSVPECKRSDCSRCDLSVIVKSLQSVRIGEDQGSVDEVVSAATMQG